MTNLLQGIYSRINGMFCKQNQIECDLDNELQFSRFQYDCLCEKINDVLDLLDDKTCAKALKILNDGKGGYDKNTPPF